MVDTTSDPQETLQRSGAFEQAPSESEEWSRLVMEAAPTGMIMVDSGGRIVLANAQVEKLFGYLRRELIGQPVDMLVPEGFRTQHPQLRTGFLDAPQARSMGAGRDLYGLRKDGTQVPVEIGLSRLETPAGKFVLSSIVDITERKQAEDALRAVQTELEERNSELMAQGDMVRTLSGRLLQAQDEERRHIARELHDGVGQLLAAIAMNLSIVESEKERLSPIAAKSVEDNLRLVGQVSKDIRTTSYLLHPPLLDEIGLESALAWYVEGFAQRSKIVVSLELSPDLGRLPRDVELSIYRIVQECLTNIHRHSKSLTATVRLYRSAGEVKVEVKDQGKGIPPEKQLEISSGEASGMGLRGMLERVRLIGGTFDIQSDGRGTLIAVALPLILGRAEINRAFPGPRS